MADLNHFAISAELGSILGPKVSMRHGQFGSAELAATLSDLLRRRNSFVQSLGHADSLSLQYEKAVTSAFKLIRDGYSSDRVLADPAMDRKFIRACRDFGLEDTVFRLNMALVGLRKHNKLKVGKSRRAVVPDQWKYAVASEIAARVMHYRYGVSVDTVLSHPTLVKEFDDLAKSVTPGFTAFQYRWAALNMRKKGASERIKSRQLASLEWSHKFKFNTLAGMPADKGVYALRENDVCLFVAGTENIHESIASQQRLVDVPLFPPNLWIPNPQRLFWRYVRMPGSLSGFRYGVVHALVAKWKPIFNIPRGMAIAA